jgi:hypothetical protein
MIVEAGVASVKLQVTWNKWPVAPEYVIVCGEEVKVLGLTDFLLLIKLANPVLFTVPPDHGGARCGWQTVVLSPNLLC